MNFSKSEQQTYNRLIQLGSTPDEATQTILDDRAIQQGEKLFELTAEQKKASAKARRAERTKQANAPKRERKADTDKREIISLLDDALCDLADNVHEVTNPERQIDFEYNNRRFRIVLSAPRK